MFVCLTLGRDIKLHEFNQTIRGKKKKKEGGGIWFGREHDPKTTSYPLNKRIWQFYIDCCLGNIVFYFCFKYNIFPSTHKVSLQL